MIAVADDQVQIGAETESASSSDSASHSEFDARFTSEFEDDVPAEPAPPRDPSQPEPEPAPEPASARSRKGIGGPKTPEGRARSSRNALKHGLRARTLLPDELAERIERRIAEFANEFRPESPVQAWLVAQAARASVQLDQCAEMELMNMEWRIMRAESIWDIEARSAVEDLALRLPRDPTRVAATLRLSTHGVAWILERLEPLARILERKGGWTEEQTRLALDLFGVPREVRDEATWPLVLGLSGPDPAGLAVLLREEIARLRAAKAERLDAMDEEERERTLMGAPTRDDASTRTLKRYQSEHRRVLRWALQEFRLLQVQEREADGPPARNGEPAAPAPRQTNSTATSAPRQTNSRDDATRSQTNSRAAERTAAPAPRQTNSTAAPAPRQTNSTAVSASRQTNSTAVSASRQTNSTAALSGFVRSSVPGLVASRHEVEGNRRDRRARAKLARQSATILEMSRS